MSFLYPSFLWALLAVAIPVIIHLLNLQRPVKLDFPSIHFLEQVKKETSSKRKIKHWLILAARCLFIAFLVLAFAQPFFHKKDEPKNYANTTLYIDNSYSMENEPSSEISALETAKQLAIRWIGSQPNFTTIGLQTNNSFQEYESAKKMIDAISRIEYTSQANPLEDIVRKHDLQKLILFSDFQRAYFEEIAQFKQDSTLAVDLVVLNQGNQENIFIDSVWVNNIDQETNQTSLSVSVRSVGGEQTEKVALKLYANDLLIGNSTADLSQGKAVVTFDLSNTNNEEIVGYIELDDNPIVFDNAFHFKLADKEKQRIVVIDLDNKNDFLKNVYQDSSLFEVSYYTNTSIPEEEINKASVVVYRGGIDKNPIWDDYVRNGGRLLFIPSDKAWAYKQWSDLLGIRLRSFSSEGAESLEISDQNNPFFKSVFKKKQENINMPSASQLVRFSSNTSIIQYPDQTPFFLSNSHGEGLIFSFTSPITDEYTNFHKHAMCIPVFYKVALDAISFDQPLYFRSGQETVSIRLENEKGSLQAYHLQNETTDIIPNQVPKGENLILDLPEDIPSGVFSLTQGKETSSSVAVNHRSKESNTSYFTQEELENVFSSSSVSVFSESDFDAKLVDIKLAKSNIPLWKYCVVLSLLFLLAEIALIRFLV